MTRSCLLFKMLFSSQLFSILSLVFCFLYIDVHANIYSVEVTLAVKVITMTVNIIHRSYNFDNFHAKATT